MHTVSDYQVDVPKRRKSIYTGNLNSTAREIGNKLHSHIGNI